MGLLNSPVREVSVQGAHATPLRQPETHFGLDLAANLPLQRSSTAPGSSSTPRGKRWAGGAGGSRYPPAETRSCRQHPRISFFLHVGANAFVGIWSLPWQKMLEGKSFTAPKSSSIFPPIDFPHPILATRLLPPREGIWTRQPSREGSLGSHGSASPTPGAPGFLPSA